MIRRSNPKSAKVVVTTSKEEEGRDWTQLYPELLHLISKKIENMSNMIRFRAVCKEWCLAANPADSPAQLPWLICPTLPTTEHAHKEKQYLLYSSSSNTTHQIYLPISNECSIEGSSTGFLFVSDTCQHFPFLLNPVTGTKIALPFLDSSKHLTVCLGRDPNSNSIMAETELYLVVVRYPGEIYGCHRDMVIEYVRFSQHDHTIKHIAFTIQNISPFISPYLCRSIAYYNGMLFQSLQQSQVTWIYDVTSGTKMSVAIPHPDEYGGILVLIEAMGDLLGVAYPGWFDGPDRSKFAVYQLMYTDDFGCCRWTNLKGIGTRILFLQLKKDCGPTYTSGFCLKAGDIKGSRGNCIYFVKQTRDSDLRPGESVCRYDIEDGTTQKIHELASYASNWLLPSLC